MSREEQKRRRALKLARKQLDREIGALAAQAKPVMDLHLPSTRTHQARWHHDLARTVRERIAAYQNCVAHMHAIERALALGPEPDCTCERIDVDLVDARRCPQHDPREARAWA